MGGGERSIGGALLVSLALLAVAVIVGTLVYEVQPWKDPTQVARFMERMGLYAPLVYAALIAVAVIVPPVPDTVPVIVAGASFGAIPAAVYSLIGITIGSSASFYLARRYGRRLLGHYLARAAAQRLDAYVASMGWSAAFTGTLIGVNSGLVSYAAGLANMRYGSFLSATLLGVLPHVVVVTATGQALRGHALLLVAGALASLLLTALVRRAWRNARRRRAARRGKES